MDEITYYPIDNNCVLKHVIYPSETEFGVHVLILKDKRGGPTNDVGPVMQEKIKPFLKKHDCRPVILQTCLPGSNFDNLEIDKSAVVMTHENYLNLLKFFSQDWNRISARIASDCKEMSTGTDFCPISSALFFKSEGMARYKCDLGKYGKDQLFLIVQGNALNNFIEMYFQINSKLTWEGIFLSPMPMMLLSKDLETLENILNYKCKKSELVAC